MKIVTNTGFLQNDFPGLNILRYKLPYISILAFTVVSTLFFYIGVIKHNELFVLGIITGLILIYFFIKYPRFWLYTVTATLFVFFRSSEEGVSVLDVISGILYLVTLFSWIIWQIAFKRVKLVNNIGDWFILAFFILLIGNSVIAVINGVSLLNWLREYSIMSIILFYFPLRHYFSEEKHLKRLLVLFAFVCVLTALKQFYDYYHIGMVNVVYAYQILITRNINQVLFTTASAFGILFVLYEKKYWKQLIILLFTIINVVALITSFSRTFWIILIIEIILFFILLPFKSKLKLGLYTLLISSAFFITVSLAFKNASKVAIKAVEHRLGTSTRGIKDPSVQARLVEYNVILKHISNYPLGGNGLEKEFSFLNPIKKNTTHTTINHNGFLFLFYRIGIPLSLFYIFFLFFYFIKSFIIFYKSKYNIYKIIAVGSTCAIFTMIISNISSTQFNGRDSVFVLAFAFAFIQIAEKKLLENKN